MSDYSIVRQDRFIEATRDSGYKGTHSALSELIDNSIQARASSVAIHFIAPEDTDGRRSPRVAEVVISDDGEGMDADTLRSALRFGGSSRFNDRVGLGRFGMGLPNASVSQCRRVEVFSWRRGEPVFYTYIDVDEIATGSMTTIPEPEVVNIPVPYEAAAQSPSGTIIVWKKCDRLDLDGKRDPLVSKLRPGLGRIFRYFLIRNFVLSLNDIQVRPIDPLHLMPQARLPDDSPAIQWGDTTKLEVEIPHLPGQKSIVEVTFSLLPEEWQTEYGPARTTEQKDALRSRQIDVKSGNFSVVRANREIDLINSPFHAKHWTDTWYRTEFRFDPVLDEVFGVTHTKQHARISSASPLFEALGRIVRPNVATLKGKIVSRGKEAHRRKQSGENPAEALVKRVGPLLRPIEALQEKDAATVRQEASAFLQARIAAGMPAATAQELGRRLEEFDVLVEFESLPGAPFYRVQVVGHSIVVMINIAHLFYERVYQKLEVESPTGRKGIDLLLMALARGELLGSDELREWYEVQRQEWSQHLKVFLSQLPDDATSGPDSEAA